MRLNDDALNLLAARFPNLTYDEAAQKILGQLDFCAAYDERTGKVTIGDEDSAKRLPSFLCDSFSVRINLARASEDDRPKVYEVGGRYEGIAANENVKPIDLHFYPDGSCCLELNYAPDPSLTLGRFMDELVVPFFYRLSYTDRYGLEAARRNLWGEYSHGDQGYREYESEILSISAKKPGRNDLCPCESGRKYKRCHLDEVNAVKSKALREMASRPRLGN